MVNKVESKHGDFDEVLMRIGFVIMQRKSV